MALIGNYSVLSKHPGRAVGGGAIGLGMNRADFNTASQARGAFASSAWSPKSGTPDGYRPPYAWVLPLTAGALTARKNLSGASTVTIAMAGGVNGEASLSGSGDLTATGALIISMVAALTGSGTISSAAAVGYLNLAASLAGAGDLDGAATAIAHAAAAVAGSGTATATATALGELAASIVVTGTALNSANVGAAVWATLIEAGFDAAQILRLIMAAAGGEVTGAPGGPIEVLGLDGTTVRLTGDVDADGNRTMVVVDAD